MSIILRTPSLKAVLLDLYKNYLTNNKKKDKLKKRIKYFDILYKDDIQNDNDILKVRKLCVFSDDVEEKSDLNVIKYLNFKLNKNFEDKSWNVQKLPKIFVLNPNKEHIQAELTKMLFSYEDVRKSADKYFGILVEKVEKKFKKYSNDLIFFKKGATIIRTFCKDENDAAEFFGYSDFDSGFLLNPNIPDYNNVYHRICKFVRLTLCLMVPDIYQDIAPSIKHMETKTLYGFPIKHIMSKDIHYLGDGNLMSVESSSLIRTQMNFLTFNEHFMLIRLKVKFNLGYAEYIDVSGAYEKNLKVTKYEEYKITYTK